MSFSASTGTTLKNPSRPPAARTNTELAESGLNLSASRQTTRCAFARLSLSQEESDIDDE